MASPGNLPVASIQRSVARWESPTDRTKPGDRYQYLLARIYAKTSTGSWALGTGSDFAVLMEALRHFGTSPQRIDRLVDSITHARKAPSPTPVRPTDDLVDHLDVTVATLNQQVGSTPFVRLQLQLAPVLYTCRKLLAAGLNSYTSLPLLVSHQRAASRYFGPKLRDFAHQSRMSQRYGDAARAHRRRHARQCRRPLHRRLPDHVP